MEKNQQPRMKWGRAISISLPFFALTVFWQTYDYVVPLILSGHYRLGTTLYSVIMSADNVTALIFLPIFGILSDRIRGRLGRRTPLILIGIIGGICGLYFMNRADAMAVEGEQTFRAFFFALLVAVFFMSLARSPSAALVADCFIRPQRTKANAVLNLMGAVGAVLFGIFGHGLIFEKDDVPIFTRCLNFVILMMVAGTVAYFLLVRENRFVEEVKEQNRRYGLLNEKTDDSSHVKLTASEVTSLWLVLASSFFIYMGYNGFHTHYTNYLVTYLRRSASWTGPYLLEVGMGMLMMIPAALLTSVFGRRKSCLIGSVLCAVGYFGVSLVTPERPTMLYLWFFIAAFGFPLVGINMGPMVLEIGKDSDSGRYMSYYYMATTGAQIFAPTFASLFINRWDYHVVGFYGALFTMLAFLAFLFVRHGDTKPAISRAVDDAVSSED